MLVRVLVASSFFQIAAISAASAVDSDASCDATTITAEPNVPLGRAPMIGCFQKNSVWDDATLTSRTNIFDQVNTVDISSALLEQIQKTIRSSTSISKSNAPEGLVAAEHYGAIVLTAISNTFSKQSASTKSPLMPSADTETHSLYNDIRFEALAPFAPMYEDGASWK